MNELKQLSTALAEHADRLERAPGVPYETCVRLTNIAERMEELAHDAQEEIDSLKAQVEALREFLELIVEWKEYGFEKAKTLLDSTPAQCLAEIKAQAGRDGFMEGARHAYSQGLTSISNVADEYSDAILDANKIESLNHIVDATEMAHDWGNQADEHANQLRQQAVKGDL